MEELQIYERLSDIFHSVFDDDVVVSPQLSADDVDGWDSLTHLRLIISVQKAFGVKFSAAEVGELDNVGDLVKLIKSKR
jgi:acyl carrier protein